MDSHVHLNDVCVSHTGLGDLSAGMHCNSAPVAGQPTPAVHVIAECCLTQLALLAVQPACLKAHPQAPPQHHQQPQHAVEVAAGVGGLLTSQQQDLLLHLEATFHMTQAESVLNSSSTSDAASLSSTAAYQEHIVQKAAAEPAAAMPGVSAGAAMLHHAHRQANCSSPVQSAAPGFMVTSPLTAKAAEAAVQSLAGGMKHVQASSSSATTSAPSGSQLETLLPAKAVAAAVQPHAEGAALHEAAVQHLQATASSEGGHLMTPVPLPHAQLEIVVLSRQMQLLQRQQLQLLQLVQQQQEGHGQQDNDDILQTVNAKQPPTTGGSTWRSAATASGSSSGGSRNISSCSVLLNVVTSIPSLPSNRLLDCVHLVLMISSCEPQQQRRQQQQRPSEQQPLGKSTETPSSGMVIADVPLLVLPAAAQQEVQQLLLPAMRQEVQAEQQELGMTAPTAVDDILSLTRLSLQMEHLAWRHYCQLAKDIHAVVQLSLAAEAEAANTGAATGTQPSCSPASATAQVALVPNVAQGWPAATATEAASPAAALELLAESLLFPLLLPFLASQGMHNTLQLLLLCLPSQLQQQWHQQQLVKLQELVNTGPAPRQLSLFSTEQQPHAAALGSHQNLQQREQQHEQQSPSHVDNKDEGSPTQVAQQRQLPDSTSTATAACDQANNVAKASTAEGSSSSSKQSSVADDNATSHSTALAPQRKPHVHTSEAVAAATSSAGIVHAATWYMPLTQFQDTHMEHSYLAWKHHSLLHLDYMSALFGLFYLAVLVRRMMSETTTLFYFAVILTKVLPFVPLMLGRWQFHFRYRELLMSLVAPIMAVTACSLVLHSKLAGTPLIVLPDRAHSAYWKSRGELQTSVMRSFTHHMRLRPYILATLIDACVSCWAFTRIGVSLAEAGSRYGVAAMVSVGFSWLLDWYMRHRYVGAQQRQRPLREVGAGS